VVCCAITFDATDEPSRYLVVEHADVDSVWSNANLRDHSNILTSQGSDHLRFEWGLGRRHLRNAGVSQLSSLCVLEEVS
jgi:hypothetical protein